MRRKFAKSKLNRVRLMSCTSTMIHLPNTLNLALDGKDKTRLSNLRAELDKLRKAKDEYVKEHPEHRKLVYGEPSATQSRGSDVGDNKPTVGAVRQLFGKDGLPLHPERSIYYDRVLNRYGVPPPGMPYMEKRKCGVALSVTRLKLFISNAIGRNGGRFGNN